MHAVPARVLRSALRGHCGASVCKADVNVGACAHPGKLQAVCMRGMVRMCLLTHVRFRAAGNSDAQGCNYMLSIVYK